MPPHPPYSSRRTVVCGLGCTALGILLGVLGTPIIHRRGAQRATALPHPPSEPSTASVSSPLGVPPTLALSLTVLQAEVAQVQAARQPLADQLTQLGGLNRLEGFLTEPDGELILLGAHDPALPALPLEDLVVSLRNAYQVGSAYHDAPGCTIDPWPGTKDPWQIQTVRVFGMPASTPMAARHVALDYELKQVSAAVVSLGEEVPSLYALARAAAPLCTGTSPQASETTATHRFWFAPHYPPAPRFLRDTGIVRILAPVAVQLLTEQEFLDQHGQRTKAAPPDLVAADFARRLTQRLTTDPHYARLRQDFWVIEFGRLLRFQDVPAASLRVLLQDYPLPEVPVPAFVGGVRRDDQGDVVCASEVTEHTGRDGRRLESRERHQQYHFAFRGGVEARIRLSADQVVEEPTGALAALRHRVRAARPTARVLVWPLAS